MIECVKTDLLSTIQNRIKNKIDILLFNPPYVPSDHKNIGTSLVHGIDAAWAGGERGRQVLDRMLPYLHVSRVFLKYLLFFFFLTTFKNIISTNGCFYLVAIQDNDPLEICNILKNQGFTPKVINFYIKS
jgi:release factor glutamine methyltransferase